jgi:site-specific DNA recombinase
VKRLAFYGRVSTEDQQDPEASRGWQLSRARQLVEPAGCAIVDEFFDVGTSRSLPWKRRPEGARLLDALAKPDRGFDGVVIGEPQRAFYGNQFSLTFPVFTHYGVQLWVPEVGGPVDPGSEAHDLVMNLFGGMSKGERTRIQLRTRAAMSDLASRTDRFLGGRPPYGYRLVDAGPHPNPGRAAAGQRAHRLVADEVTAPVVRDIFESFVGGAGVRAIAQRLTDTGIPSPSAHDPARNSHRDPRGWAFSAVRAILTNEAYTGRRLWAKQQKFEELLDPDDVAAGNRTRLRWRPEDQWIRPEVKTHIALVEDDLFVAARGRLASTRPGTRKPRSSIHAYPLRGILFCSICGRRMEGTWRKAKTGETGRVLYRCALRHNRALTQDFPDHPNTLYLSEDAILEPLDQWIASITTSEALAEHQGPSAQTTTSTQLRAKLAEVDRKIASLIAAIEAGVDLPLVSEQLNRRARERDGLEAELRSLPRERVLSPTEMRQALDQLGGIANILAGADSSTREKIYNSLGVQMVYDHVARRVTVAATDACVHNRVRRGT